MPLPADFASKLGLRSRVVYGRGQTPRPRLGIIPSGPRGLPGDQAPPRKRPSGPDPRLSSGPPGGLGHTQSATGARPLPPEDGPRPNQPRGGHDFRPTLRPGPRPVASGVRLSPAREHAHDEPANGGATLATASCRNTGVQWRRWPPPESQPLAGTPACNGNWDSCLLARVPPDPCRNTGVQWDRGGDDPVRWMEHAPPYRPRRPRFELGVPHALPASGLSSASTRVEAAETGVVGLLVSPFQGKGKLLVGERPSPKPPMPKTALSGFQTDARLQAPSPRQGGLPRGGKVRISTIATMCKAEMPNG
ncbi:PREDICTED: proline-rich protein 2-like [Vollenhovia emeryi]|uniref:proline-rich protein 2-like n=1 Tax=Vollenhovia emeryi TaxID=411798 RepID=UPI0005F45CF9|nr:PREDICTED: proline-rich protein 2-like [Vollenhovia emeryi]